MQNFKSKLKNHELDQIQAVFNDHDDLFEKLRTQVEEKVTVDALPEEPFKDYDQKLFRKFMEHFVEFSLNKPLKDKDIIKMLEEHDFDNLESIKAFGSEGVTLLIQDYLDFLNKNEITEDDVTHLADIMALRNELAQNEYDYIKASYALFLKKQIQFCEQ